MNEERMIELAQRLGARAAERLDVGATARNVVARLQEPPVERTVWIQQTWLRIAATVVVLIGGSFALLRLANREQRPDGIPHVVAHFVADDLNDLSTDQLRDVLATFDEVVTDSSAVPESSPDLRELDARQLRAMLRSLEG